MKPKTISATSLNLYNACPRQWKFRYVYHLLQPDNPAFIIGTAYHKALELYHSGKTPEEIIEQTKKKLMPNKTKEEIDRFGIVRKMFECYQANPSEGETIKTEYKFTYPLGDILDENVNLIGYIDRVTPDSIIDYKTTGKDYTEEDCIKNIQTDVYSYVASKIIHGKLPNVTYHIMNKKKVGKNNYKPQTFTIKRTEEDMKNFEEKIKEFYKNVTDEKFEAKQGTHCFWCSFRNVCKLN